MGNLLELQGISKSFGDDIILSDISFALAPETVVAIIGQSGGGKTTLLSIMGLLQKATTGRVLIAGQSVECLSPHKMAKVRGQYLSFVFQRARLINYLTALENVIAPAWFIRRGEKVEQQAKALLERFGLSHRLEHKPQELSLGQLRRISLARALLLKPSILLADEPTNDLDPALAEEVAGCLLGARQTGTSVVIVTHDLGLAARADQTFRLADGTLHAVAGQ